MGTRRKKAGAGAVERVVYDIFGNVIGNTDTPATPAQPAEPVMVPQPPTPDITPDVTPVYRTGRDLTQELGKTDIYSPNVQKLFSGNAEAVATSPVLQRAMGKIGLDPLNTEHQEIFATMFGIWRAATTQSFNPARVSSLEQEILNGQGAIGIASQGRIAGTRAQVMAARILNIQQDGSVMIDNQSYVLKDPDDKMAGAGYAMLRMQAAAARRYSEITGRQVTIRTHALSRDPRLRSRTGVPWVGAHVWPKLGYNFALEGADVPTRLTEAVRAAGFRSTNTHDLMTERRSDGMLGYDLWPSIVNQTIRTNSEVFIWGRMQVTNDNDRGLQVMQNYGRNKGFDKGRLNGVNGMALSATDDAILRQLWLDAGKK
jgi:hypothetical protein